MLKLEDYHISEVYGFILEDPKETLPYPFSQWVDLTKRISPLLENHEFRTEVKKLPLLDHDDLTGYRNLRLAHLVLSFMSSGYVWQEGDSGVAKILPSNLAIPLHGISKRLGLQPILAHVDGCLANITKIDPDGNLRCLFTLPGGREFEWFFLVTAQIEIEGVPALKALVRAIHYLAENDAVGLVNDLHKISDTICAMRASLKRMHEGLTAATFYNVIRPYLSGFGGDGSPLPKGLIYEGVSDKPVALAGGSAAQSSVLQCFDAALGIVHEEEKQGFLVKMRDHMPPDHVAFINRLAEGPSIRDFVETSRDLSLQKAYNNTIECLKGFRTYHIQMVAKYIIAMAAKSNRNRNVESLAKRGTGGQALIPFLKSIQNTTDEAAVKPDEEVLR